MYTGPNLIKDRLAFGYDTGYGVSNNNTATRFYPGEPTTNVTPLADFIDTSNWTGGGWQGSIAVSSDYDNTLEITAYNGWRTFAINHGITTGGTVSVSFEYKLKSAETSNIFGLVLNGRNLGSYHNNLGDISNSDLKTRVWKKYNGSFTANSNSYGAELAIGLRGSDNAGENNVMYIRNLQVEQKGHSTPYAQTSRSNTSGLIDLKRTIDISLANASFDSTGQPTFDGTSDYISKTRRQYTTEPWSVETIFKPTDATDTSWNGLFGGSLGQGGYWFFHSAGNLGLYSSSGYITYRSWTKANTFIVDEFHHLVITYTPATTTTGTFNLYYNGGEKTMSFSFTFSNIYTLDSQFIGMGGGNRYGTNDVAVYKEYEKVLSADEVKQNYKAYKNRFNI